MAEPLLELRNVRFSYEDDNVILNDLNIIINAGEKIAVIGGNGSGKTTFFHYIKGILPRLQGELYLSGKKIGKGRREDLKLIKEIGYVFQDPEMQIIGSSVENEISFGLKNIGLPDEQIGIRVEAVMERLNLSRYWNAPPHLLSGGEKKRVSIADIVVMEPEMLLFDEPTASLDKKNQDIFEEMLAEDEMKRKTILISTHDLDFVWRWAERVLLFAGGKVIGDGRPEVLFADGRLLEQAALKPPLLYRLIEKLCEKKGCSMPETIPKSMEEIFFLLDEWW